MSRKLNVVLLYGGKSGEHEVSLVSAASVLSQLNPERYTIIPVAMDKNGCIYLNNYRELLAYGEALPVITSHSQQLDSLLSKGRFALEADVVFSVAHGPLYEDGCLQGLLELADIAYVGSDVLSSAIGMDKDIARRLVSLHDVRFARYRLLSWHANSADIKQFCLKTSEDLGWPLFVKPNTLGSSVGIHKAKNIDELLLAVDDARRYSETVMIEEFIKGREIEVSVLENLAPMGAPKVSLPGEIRVSHPDGFYSYTAKYLESEQTELITPAELSEQLVQQLQRTAADIFTILKCKGMARVDFFVNDHSGDVYFNEINTIPGFTPISMYPKMWQASGLPYQALLDQLIDLAIKRYHGRQQLVTHYQ